MHLTHAFDACIWRMHLTHAFDAFDVCIWRMHLTHAFDACICGGRLRISVTRCGNYWKILATNISNKRSPNDWQLFGLLEKLLWKNCFGYFLGNFLKYLGYFYCKIWSNWLQWRKLEIFPICFTVPILHSRMHQMQLVWMTLQDR